MFLALDGDEIEVANVAATFLADAMPIDRLHGANSADMADALRHTLGEMGWFALAVPEAAGGSGLSAVEHSIFFREVGRQCGPIDVLAQCLGALTAQDSDLRASLLAGTQSVALTVSDGAGVRLFGTPDANFAVSVTYGGARLVDLTGLKAALRPALDPANSMRTLDALPPTSVSEVRGDKVWQFGQLGIAAMLVGIAEASLNLIVEYAKIRETFGRKIGAYQAVRHPCADMALRAESARAQLWFAATAIKEGRDDAGLHLDAAKHLANQAALLNADVNIQLHGGIGVTDEHRAHLMLKHALVLVRLFGSKRALLARILNARLDD